MPEISFVIIGIICTVLFAVIIRAIVTRGTKIKKPNEKYKSRARKLLEESGATEIQEKHIGDSYVLFKDDKLKKFVLISCDMPPSVIYDYKNINGVSITKNKLSPSKKNGTPVTVENIEARIYLKDSVDSEIIITFPLMVIIRGFIKVFPKFEKKASTAHEIFTYMKNNK